MSTKRSDSLNEALKRREQRERERLLTEVTDGGEKVMALDDTQRVKVLSPGRLVAKRFFRNKLAIVGLVILIFMFTFSFLFPIFYPYSQTQIFYKYDGFNVDYASATERTEYTSYSVNDEVDVHYSVKNRISSYVTEMETSGQTERVVTDDAGVEYILEKKGDKVYTLSTGKSEDAAIYHSMAPVAEYSKFDGSFKWRGEELDAGFQEAAAAAVEGGKTEFSHGGEKYSVTMSMKNIYTITRANASIEHIDGSLGGGFDAALTDAIGEGLTAFDYEGKTYHLRSTSDGVIVYTQGDRDVALVASTFVFDLFDVDNSVSDSFKTGALLALYDDGEFEADGEKYTIDTEGEIITIHDSQGKEFAELNTYSVRRYSGQDTLPLEFKKTTLDVIDSMIESGENQASFVYALPAMDENAEYIYDENGDLTYEDTDLTITRTPTQFVINCNQTTHLIDIHAGPTKAHWFGTDGDGMDILARTMYGGRISLMVGFVVVILEMILGIIMGGIAGFFGGWVDTLIMRLVDIFYCIPSMPILIITGAFFDEMKMNAYVRLIYLMAILGILGWAGVARLVRGQILSLREQEFMIAEEATGMRASKRIFRHLIPNVMPQLIVSATMGLGNVIITESTLSFLGLGVKHPLATWGNMINSVTGSSEDMIKYTYIWIPVGMLICLTVIAFNFVGDGLRDAFDPKMKQ